jgi:hypothetical protein
VRSSVRRIGSISSDMTMLTDSPPSGTLMLTAIE